MRPLVAWIALLSGCGSPIFTTKHGIAVFDETEAQYFAPRQAEIERMSEITAALYGTRLEVLDGLSVFGRDGQCPNGRDGCYFEGEERIQLNHADSECLACLPFGHELIHHFEYSRYGRGDHDHTKPALWGPDGILLQSINEGARELCPDLKAGEL